METETATEETLLLAEMDRLLSDKESQRDDRGIENTQGMRLSQKADITYGDVHLKGRTRLWRSDDGKEVWLPTAQLMQHLRKRRPDGQRLFVSVKPPIAQQVPIDAQCEICVRANGRSRKFYSMSHYEDHMEILHPREWEREQRERDRRERKEERDVLRALVEKRPEEGITNARDFKCDDCGKEFSKKVALVGHQRTHLSAVRK